MKKIAFQGMFGAYSDAVARDVLGKSTQTIPCENFETVLKSVKKGQVDFGLLPFENSTAGQVDGVHRLIAKSGLKIFAEYEFAVKHCLLGCGKIADIKTVYSHPQALFQTEKNCKKLNAKQIKFFDTAGSAQMVAEKNDKTKGAIASALAGKIYGLKILQKNLQDMESNTTKFWLIGDDRKSPFSKSKYKNWESAIIVEVKNHPAVLYKVLGGFATANVDLTRIESYKYEDKVKFLLTFKGGLSDSNVKIALSEVEFFAKKIDYLGSYPILKG